MSKECFRIIPQIEIMTNNAAAGFRDLMNREGGSVPGVAAANLMGTSPAALRRAAIEGKVIAVQDGRGDLMVPIWQFDEHGRVLRGIPDTVAALRVTHPHYDDLVPIVFFLNPSPRLGGRSPLESLRSGDIEQVLAQARLAGE